MIRYCFVEKMSKDGLLTSTSVSVIDEWFKWIKETKNAPVDLISKFSYLFTENNKFNLLYSIINIFSLPKNDTRNCLRTHDKAESYRRKIGFLAIFS